MFDFLIVGAGLFGATCARLLSEAGKSVMVIEKRGQIGGNCFDEWVDDLLVNRYGGHIFHTNSAEDMEFCAQIQRFQGLRAPGEGESGLEGVQFSDQSDDAAGDLRGQDSGRGEEIDFGKHACL